MRHHDVLVIGTGSGNTILDERFAGRDVALVEQRDFGGTCLNAGCIPTKMLAYTAGIAEQVRQASGYGVAATLGKIRWSDIRERVFSRLDAHSHSGRRHRLEQPGVTVHLGRAEFTGPRTMRVERTDGTGVDEISADRIVIAAGGRPSVPPPVTSSSVSYQTSDTIMRIDRLPDRLANLGGGHIAAEFAHVFGGPGCAVTIVRRGRPAGVRDDETISARFTELARRRFDVRVGLGVTEVTGQGDGVRLVLDDGPDPGPGAGPGDGDRRPGLRDRGRPALDPSRAEQGRRERPAPVGPRDLIRARRQAGGTDTLVAVTTTAEKATELLRLHTDPELLLVVNVWDAITATVVADTPGTAALATASHGIAAAHGYPDGEHIPRDEMIAAVGLIARTAGDLPVTADLEAGYGDPGGTVARAIDVGVAGANLEDQCKPLADSVAAVEAAVAAGEAAGVAFVLNARTDAFLKAGDRDPEAVLAEAIERGRAYLGAGAASFFVPGKLDEKTVQRLVEALGERMVNIIGIPGSIDLAAAQRLGVARVSYGPWSQNVALTALARLAEDVYAGGGLPADTRKLN